MIDRADVLAEHGYFTLIIDGDEIDCTTIEIAAENAGVIYYNITEIKHRLEYHHKGDGLYPIYELDEYFNNGN